MQMATLENDQVRLTLDDHGRLIELVHRPSGHNYAGGNDIWRLFYRLGQRFQQEITAGENTARLIETDRRLTLLYDTLKSRDGELHITLQINVTLDGEQAIWSCQINHRDERVVIKELHLPIVGRCNIPTDHALIHTALGGSWEDDPKAFVRNRYPDRRHWYQCEDHKGLHVQHIYPSVNAACNCFVLAGSNWGLYFGSHDPTFRNTIHLWRLEGDDWTDFEAGFVKHLFLNPGDSLTIEGFVLSPYTGSWHAAADHYGNWARTWYKPLPKPDWIDGGKFRGWHRIIHKHQNGEVLFPYDTMPRIHADGKAAGIDGLFMFGWWPGGMDRMYPDYVPDPELGGEQTLRDNIRRFQDELGGHTILYASGRLVDRQSNFYKQHGRKCSIKKASGDEAGDAYLFGNRATYERMYGAVELVPMCLDCSEWVDQLKRVIDLAVDYGCHGVFFDQLGLTEYPCCDPTHGHPVPYVMQPQGKRRVVESLRDYARSRDPQLAFGVEVFADAIGQYCDFVHGLYFQLYIAGNPDYQVKGEKAETVAFIDWSRYLFPELIISDRDIRDERDFERRVNIALLRGLIHDIEIYRCRKTIAHTPKYQQYLGRINALRDRHEALLAHNAYRDTLGFTIDNQAVDARAFVNGSSMAVLLTQSHLERATVSVCAPGYDFESIDGIGDFQVMNQTKVTLGRHAVVMLIYTQTEGGIR